MKVSVKKRVLFNILKERLNENRDVGNDNGGRLIHPFNQSPSLDPFGVMSDDDLPVRASKHMSVQLSIEEPPVDDEEYVPGTASELISAAAVICREVPLSQIEYFYRQLHMLLDKALERSNEYNPDFMNESFNITKKTTIREFDIISEASRIRTRRSNTPPDHDSDAYREAENKESFLDGYNAGRTDANPSEELANQKSMGSQDYINGYIQAMREDEMGDEDLSFASDVDDFDLPFPHEDEVEGRKSIQHRNFQQYLTRSAVEEVMDQPFESLDPFERAVFNMHDELQDLFKKIDMEFTNEMLNPDLEKELMALMKPLTNAFGMSHREILNPLNVKRMFASVGRTKNPEKKEELMNSLLMTVFTRISNIVETLLQRDKRVNKMIMGLAQEAGMPMPQFVLKLKEAITQDYASYGTASRFESDDDLVKQKIEQVFAILIKSLKIHPDEDTKFKNKKHFLNRVNLSTKNEIEQILIDTLQKFKKGDQYVLTDQNKTVNISSEEFEQQVASYIDMLFDMAKEMQQGDPVEEDDVDDVDEELPAGLTPEEEYQRKVEMYAKKITDGKSIDWIDLAPFFGFSNVSGIRQWFLKKVEPKIRIFTYRTDKDDPQARSNINDLHDQNMQLFSKQMVEVINDVLIPDLEKKVSKGKAKKLSVDTKKNKIKQIDEAQFLKVLKNQILPMLDAINHFLDQGVSFTDLSNESEFMQTIAGKVLRNVGSFTLDTVIDNLSNEWSESIKQVINPIIKKYNPQAADLNEAQLNSVVEYFTGLKGVPDFENKSKAAKNLLAVNITPDVYIEIAIEAANAWEDLADQFEDYDGAQFADQMIDEADQILDNPNEFAKKIEAAFKEFMQEELYRHQEKTEMGI